MIVIQVRCQNHAMEAVQQLGVGPREVPVAENPAEHAAVLALRQAAVVSAPRARLGELRHAQLPQQRGHLVVDVLGAIVGVEALHGKGERLQRTLQDRQREILRNALDAAGELVLDDLVDSVDVIHALDLVEVALMHRVDADPARAALRARLTGGRRAVLASGEWRPWRRAPARKSASGAGRTGGRCRSPLGARSGRP